MAEEQVTQPANASDGSAVAGGAGGQAAPMSAGAGTGSRRTGTPLVEMRDIRVAFGGVHAVDGVTVDLYPGEVVGLVGGNGAGKSTLMKVLSGAQPPDSGEILVDGKVAHIATPADAQRLGIETIYQNLALADNQHAPANVFLGRELTTRWGSLDDSAMETATREVMGRLNPHFSNFKRAVQSLSGGQRQAVAIARAVHFQARALIMDEPTAALGPAETAMVRNVIRQLKAEGIGIFLISHDIHDVFDLSDRISVMYHGKLVGTVVQDEVTTDDVLGMIILGKATHGRDRWRSAQRCTEREAGWPCRLTCGSAVASVRREGACRRCPPRKWFRGRVR